MTTKSNGLPNDSTESELRDRLFKYIMPSEKNEVNREMLVRSWIDILAGYLPEGFGVTTAHIVDSSGRFSDNFDLVVYDARLDPALFKFHGSTVVPIETVCAVFEVGFSFESDIIVNMSKKASKLDRLVPIELNSFMGGHVDFTARTNRVCCGVLAFKSDLDERIDYGCSLPIGGSRMKRMVDFGCIADFGVITSQSIVGESAIRHRQPLTVFIEDFRGMIWQKALPLRLEIRAYSSLFDIS